MASNPLWVPDRGEMIWINFNPQAGQEMKDEHPLLVFSGRAFNERTSIVIGLPMTTASFNETNPFAVKYMAANGQVGYILTHQPKSFDWRARAARPHPWGTISKNVFDAAKDGLNDILVLC